MSENTGTCVYVCVVWHTSTRKVILNLARTSRLYPWNLSLLSFCPTAALTSFIHLSKSQWVSKWEREKEKDMIVFVPKAKTFLWWYYTTSYTREFHLILVYCRSYCCYNFPLLCWFTCGRLSIAIRTNKLSHNFQSLSFALEYQQQRRFIHFQLYKQKKGDKKMERVSEWHEKRLKGHKKGWSILISFSRILWASTTKGPSRDAQESERERTGQKV